MAVVDVDGGGGGEEFFFRCFTDEEWVTSIGEKDGGQNDVVWGVEVIVVGI